MEISDGISIETYATANAINKTMEAVGTAVLAQTLDHMETQGAALTKMMEQSVHPNLGKNIDVLL